MLILLDLLALFWPAIAIPALLMLFIRPAGRLAFFVLGLLFCFGSEFAVNLRGGPDDPMMILPILGLSISVAAILAEMLVRTGRLIRNRLAPRPTES